MCGIAGVYGGVYRDELDEMLGCLTHRGPDDDGQYIDEDVPIAMGMRRLSIIDVAGGAQPIANESGDVTVVFNGEIYNHRQLREQLKENGHGFTSQTDTEVLVHLWEEYGTDLPEHLDGMFAFSIWDSTKETLFLARDRMGIKPLYFADTDNRFVWGSEIPALLEADIDRTLDEKALYQYFTLRYTPWPKTLFADIEKVPPGTSLTVTKAGVERRQYWTPSEQPIPNNFDSMADRLRQHLRRSVERRLMSDVPLGAFLSGGLDSSSIVALMSEILGDEGKEIRTFSIGFEADQFDESEEAQHVAEYFGTNHSEITIDLSSMDVFDRLIGEYGEPLADPAVLPTMLLSEFARQDVKVVQTGEGADELLAGYWYYKIPRERQRYRWLPKPVFKIAEQVGQYANIDEKSLRYFRSLSSDEQTLLGIMSRFQTPPDEYLDTDIQLSDSGLHDLVEVAFDRARNDGTFERIEAFDLTYWLPDDLLYKVDHASMAASLEARVPFLDHRLVNFIYSIPPKHKRGGYKRLLKRAMRDKLPEQTLNREKHGLGVPVGDWFRTDHDSIAKWFDESLLKQTPYINANETFELWTDHRRERVDTGLTLWKILNYVAWYDRFVR